MGVGVCGDGICCLVAERKVKYYLAVGIYECKFYDDQWMRGYIPVAVVKFVMWKTCPPPPTTLFPESVEFPFIANITL